jgi:hypothetical protein
MKHQVKRLHLERVSLLNSEDGFSRRKSVTKTARESSLHACSFVDEENKKRESQEEKEFLLINSVCQEILSSDIREGTRAYSAQKRLLMDT